MKFLLSSILVSITFWQVGISLFELQCSVLSIVVKDEFLFGLSFSVMHILFLHIPGLGKWFDAICSWCCCVCRFAFFSGNDCYNVLVICRFCDIFVFFLLAKTAMMLRRRFLGKLPKPSLLRKYVPNLTLFLSFRFC